MLAAAFEAAGVDYEIRNAEGDAANMATIADQMITDGVTVLMIVNLDNESGAQIEQRAADAGIPTIDYDRLTLGGSAAVYVSFDNVQVGVLQGEGLVKCLADRGVERPAIAVLNGSPTDNNATLAARGYISVLQPHFDDGSFTLVDDQSVPGWNNEQGGQIFEQMLSAADGAIDGVVAANDGLADAVISVLQSNDLQVPVTGQDATVDGLRHILQGDQCMTVYKDIELEADAAVATAVALAGGEMPPTTGTVTDTQTGREVPAVIAAPVADLRRQRQRRRRRRLPVVRRRVPGHRDAVRTTRRRRAARRLVARRPRHIRPVWPPKSATHCRRTRLTRQSTRESAVNPSEDHEGL